MHIQKLLLPLLFIAASAHGMQLRSGRIVGGTPATILVIQRQQEEAREALFNELSRVLLRITHEDIWAQVERDRAAQEADE